MHELSPSSHTNLSTTFTHSCRFLVICTALGFSDVEIERAHATHIHTRTVLSRALPWRVVASGRGVSKVLSCDVSSSYMQCMYVHVYEYFARVRVFYFVSLCVFSCSIGASAYALACHTLGWQESIWMPLVRQHVQIQSVTSLKTCMDEVSSKHTVHFGKHECMLVWSDA